MTNNLDSLRQRINELDRQLLKILEERFQVVGKIGEYKREQELPVRDEWREKELLEMLSRETTLDPRFLSNLYSVIFANSYLIEK